MVVLQANNLTKKYGNNLAVDNVSMIINQGDIYGFVGENGAGKTTFIRLVAGLIQSNGGDFVLFEGEKNHIGAVVETPSLFLYMNAMNNLMAQGLMVGTTDVEKHKELLRLVELEYLIDSKKKAKNFSLGMKQRLGIAMALLTEPKFLLLDEPMNGLDPEGVVLMRNLIKTLSEQGITFLISSHMLSELSKIATRYGFIHKGKLIKEITLEEMQKEVRTCVNAKVSDEDIEKVEKLLQELKVEYKVNNKIISVFDKTISEVVLLLAENGIKVNEINQDNFNIENYYLNLIGGLHNEESIKG